VIAVGVADDDVFDLRGIESELLQSPGDLLFDE
jgi:hypothetical protein